MDILCKLTDKKGLILYTYIEYNQLDSLFKERWNGIGTIKIKNGPYSFNSYLNAVVFNLKPYPNIYKETKKV